ncbi:hypothetical protein [Streptomyces sp. NPDC007088]|uniref:hypothetical protein n=1 Tax=Streptomyces sp. NPDC007088 TaxID=3364773 RepID=UPI0036AF36D1
MPDSVSTSTPGDRAASVENSVWRLRARGCWSEAACLLEDLPGPEPALRRAALLVEGCLYTGEGWEQAEDGLRTAEALARDDDARGAAACERGHLAYAATLLGIRDRADEASSALGRAAALLAPGSARRPLLDFRRGLIAEHLARAPQSARAAYRRAHAGATAHHDLLLQSYTWHHLAELALRDGELAEARHGFGQCLRLREDLGYVVGVAATLAALADAEGESEAARLRAEARRLWLLLGKVPAALAPRLRLPAPTADLA